MSQYRIYCRNVEGRFSKVTELEAKDYEEALAVARALQHPGPCEAWERDRLVDCVEERSMREARA
jgi:hypothetical protein